MRVGRGWLVGLCAAALWAPASAPASPHQESLLQDDDLLLYSGPARSDATMRELKAIGVDRVRVNVHWRNVAPVRKLADAANPAAYDATKFDAIDHLLRVAGRMGMGVLVTVTGPAPDWASGPNGVYKPDRLAYSQFVEMLGRRWSGTYKDENQGQSVLPRVTAWSLWNEPNWHTSLAPQWKKTRHGNHLSFVPRMYRQLYRAATAALERSGHGGDTIVLGETAPMGSAGKTPRSPMKPVPFLLDLFCLTRQLKPMPPAAARRRGCDYTRRGPLKATVFGHHPYPVKAGPAAQSADRDVIALGDSARLKAILDAAHRLGRLQTSLPLWYTEFGYQTAPPDPYRGISLGLHAAYLAESERITWADPRVAVHGQFLLRDDEPRLQHPETDRRRWLTWQSGLLFQDGTRKPAYEAYRLPFSAPGKVAPHTALEVWGMVRPAEPGATEHVTVQHRSSPESGWEGVRDLTVSHPRGYFTASVGPPKPGEYRFVWVPKTEQPGLFGWRTQGQGEPVASVPVRVTVG